MVHAQAAVTVTWNTHREQTTAAQTNVRICTGTLIALKGKTASLRMADGSLRTLQATPDELPALRSRIGYSISFIVK